MGVGAAIAGGLILGIKQGLAIEVERDLFSARTGLDEATSARFGRAAGEAYANAWGDSVAAIVELVWHGKGQDAWVEVKSVPAFGWRG